MSSVVVAVCSCWTKEDLGGGQSVSAVVAAVCSCWPKEEERSQCECCGGCCLFMLAKGRSHIVSSVVVVCSCWPKEEVTV